MIDPQQKAKDAIVFRDKALSKQQPSRSMWQSISDLEFPQTYGITNKISDGQELMLQLFDIAAV